MILAALIERGIDVAVPFGGGPYVGLAHIFGVYFPPTKSVYLVPLDAVGGFRGYLRLVPARNNQQRKVRFAESAEQLLNVKRSAEVLAEPQLNFA